MRTVWIGSLIVAMLAGLAVADVVYMKNGKTYEGKATRIGDKVRIETTIGGTFDVPAGDVVTIETAPAKPAESRPAEPTALPPSTAPSRGPVSLASLSQPESVAFLLMRNLAGTESGSASYEIRQQIEQMRNTAHDRKRRVGANWLTPEDFARFRAAYVAMVKEADDEIKVRSQAKTEAEKKAEALHNERAAIVKLRRAAEGWADPLLRDFLIGAVELAAKDYGRAETFFRLAVTEAPQVAAFHQGLGIALHDVKRETDSLAEFVEALRLRPDSRDILQAVKDQMTKVPGGETKTPTYKAAQKLLESFETTGSGGIGGGFSSGASSSKGTINWAMPGKVWASKDNSLPTPPVDRLVFLQGAAVPVGVKTLMVDAAVVKDAQEVFVRLDAKTVVQAQVRGRSSSSTEKPFPLALLTVEGYAFDTVADEGYAGFEAGQEVTAYALGFFEEMGRDLHKIPGKIESVANDGNVKVTAVLSPGDSAGPVLGKNGKLAGFLAGRTDVTLDAGGPNQMIPLSDIFTMLRKAAKSPGGTGIHGRNKAAEPLPAPGQVFIVYATRGEELKP